MIKFDIKPDIGIQEAEGTEGAEEIKAKKEYEGKNVLDLMFANYNLTFNTIKVQRGDHNWYEHCGLVFRKMAKEEHIILAKTEQQRLEILEQFLIEHIVDSLMMDEKIDLLNYIYSEEDLENALTNDRFKRFFGKIKKYLLSKLIVSKGITCVVLFNGPSRIENVNVHILDGKKWVLAKPEDKRDLQEAILKKYKLKSNLNSYVGFIGFETNKKYMVYKVKDTQNERSTGFICYQSGKDKIINLLNEIESGDKYASKVTKDGAYELCIRQELTLRSYELQKLNGKTWFLDTETAIINEFEKREKKKG
jgi:hypothetical protein